MENTTNSQEELIHTFETVVYFQTRVIYPIFLFVGILCNILALLTLLQKHLRKNMTYFALIIVSVCDIGVLIFGIGNQWSGFTLNFEIRTISNFICSFHVIITHCFFDYSIWILCVITFQRLLVVWSPIKFQIILSHKSTLIILIVLGFIILFKNVLFGIQFQLRESNITKIHKIICGIHQNYPNDHRDFYFAWVDLITKFLIPFPLQLILNILLVIKLKSYSSEFAQIRADISEHFKTLKRTSAILFAINISFLICYGPNGTFILVSTTTSLFEKLGQNPNENGLIKIIVYTIQQTGFTFQYLNHVINFILYLLVGKYFRKNLLSLFNLKKRKLNQNGNNTKQTRLSATRFNRSPMNSFSINDGGKLFEEFPMKIIHQECPVTVRRHTLESHNQKLPRKIENQRIEENYILSVRKTNSTFILDSEEKSVTQFKNVINNLQHIDSQPAMAN